jgi:gamma-glutamylcyclotransferase (GGCT)/AIG2-like uncharacterized protein YtfP
MNNPKLDLNYVFVYGTLKKSFPNDHYLTDSIFLGKATIQGQLLNIGPFPGLIGTGSKKDRVQGEIYIVDNETLARLDRLEGEGSLYLRKSVIAEQEVAPIFCTGPGSSNCKGHEWQGDRRIAVWTYFWNGSKDLPVIESGYWGWAKFAKVK